MPFRNPLDRRQPKWLRVYLTVAIAVFLILGTISLLFTIDNQLAQDFGNKFLPYLVTGAMVMMVSYLIVLPFRYKIEKEITNASNHFSTQG
jgi:hypothetical protein